MTVTKKLKNAGKSIEKAAGKVMRKASKAMKPVTDTFKRKNGSKARSTSHHKTSGKKGK